MRMTRVSGSAGRKHGLAVSKKVEPIKSTGAPTVTKKILKTWKAREKKALGSRASWGLSNPKMLGKMASSKKKLLLDLTDLTAKKGVKKPPSNNLVRGIKHSFTKTKLAPSPETKVTDYLKSRGLT